MPAPYLAAVGVHYSIFTADRDIGAAFAITSADACTLTSTGAVRLPAPLAVTLPPVILMSVPLPLKPPPMPAAPPFPASLLLHPPVAVIVPPVISMLLPLLFFAPPIPAPCAPPVAVREPFSPVSSLMVSVPLESLLFFSTPAWLAPLFSSFLPSSSSRTLPSAFLP